MIGPVISCHAVMGAEGHAVERGRAAWSQFSFDRDAVAMRRHANLP